MKNVLLLGILALKTTLAYNSQNRIVAVWDQITFYSTATGEEQGSWKLTSWPYVDGFETNSTQNGTMCYAETLSDFQT